jgi:hypothetical protein
MTLQTVLYTAKPQTTGGRESGAARTDDRRLDTEFTAAALSSARIFTAKWKKWYRVLRHLKDLDCLTLCALAYGWRAAERELHPPRSSGTKCS